MDGACSPPAEVGDESEHKRECAGESHYRRPRPLALSQRRWFGVNKIGCSDCGRGTADNRRCAPISVLGDLPDETIAAAGEGFNEARLVGGVLQDGANLIDRSA